LKGTRKFRGTSDINKLLRYVLKENAPDIKRLVESVFRRTVQKRKGIPECIDERALRILVNVSNNYLLGLLHDGRECARLNGRDFLVPKDIQLARRRGVIM
tara:strand:+ start:476 stop:778 length:303 start_codon:yes stop_codon:yes gene_type:complete